MNGQEKDGGAREGERIAKVLARAGVASRREAERLIEQRRVTVDGQTVTTPATLVTEGQDIRFDGERVGGRPPVRLWRYHKPDGLVTTHKDPQGRRTVFEALPPALGRVLSVGRLDLTTEGLLLLTNDGGLSRALELPSNGWRRRYRARAYGQVTQNELDRLSAGVEIDGVRYGPVAAKLDQIQGGNVWITLSITEGKNREVRAILRHLGLHVNRLIRTAYGPFQLGGLQTGAVEEVPTKQLKEQLGAKLSAELGIGRK
ncbi:pseudouridine synthase [Parvularcula dongshanensis]|uniref:Pseudouridine synthase n=1 Tax=Parvularcula dongshanensis TaxID=1173995 RepID=A0A840I278_9PROT|nr:pseudouridine synthase [Parvularcula dongshanensis]MBB4658391.1 23S rRNA pseudouridine2605 synthase [Parvularcula dongshanensis]